MLSSSLYVALNSCKNQKNSVYEFVIKPIKLRYWSFSDPKPQCKIFPNNSVNFKLSICCKCTQKNFKSCMHWFATKKIPVPSLLTLDDILTSRKNSENLYRWFGRKNSGRIGKRKRKNRWNGGRSFIGSSFNRPKKRKS